MPEGRRRRNGVRLVAFVLGLALVLVTVLVAAQLPDVDLTVVLLVVLVEVLAVAAASGPVLAAVAALVAVGTVNWFLVPPYHTFAIAGLDNLVALVVFTLVAVIAALLVEVSGRARARAAASAEQAELLGEVVSLDTDEDAAAALERIRGALGLERVVLSQRDDSGDRTLVEVGSAPAGTEIGVDVTLVEGYRLVGYGPARMGAEPEFLTSLGAAAVRAYESRLLDEEQRRVAELAALDRARTALLASVGHDLRTPLAGLRVAVDALQGPGAALDDDDRAALLDTIARSTGRLDELITNLLDMSRLEAGAVLAHPEPTALDEVVARALLGLPEARVDVAVPESLPRVLVDPALLERIVANLVSNAVRYGGSTPVAVVGRDDGGAVVLEVVDHGRGIPPADRGDVFEPFHRLGDRRDGGTGLGLAIVRGFAAATAVTVTLLDTEGGGLTARLLLPTADDGDAP